VTEFIAAVQKVQTLADGGIRLTLDLPETAVVQMAELAAYKIHGVAVRVVIDTVGLEQGGDSDGQDETRKIKF